MHKSANTGTALHALKQIPVEKALGWAASCEERIAPAHRSSYAIEGQERLAELEGLRAGAPLPCYLADRGREAAEAFLLDLVYDLCRCASDRAIGWAPDWRAEWVTQQSEAVALGVSF